MGRYVIVLGRGCKNVAGSDMLLIAGAQKSSFHVYITYARERVRTLCMLHGFIKGTFCDSKPPGKFSDFSEGRRELSDLSNPNALKMPLSFGHRWKLELNSLSF